MVYHEPLDLQYWLVNVFAGSYETFFIISLLALAILAIKFRMSSEIMLGGGLVYVAILTYSTANGLVSSIFFLGVVILILVLSVIMNKMVGNR